ncbi:cysteine-rich small domain-containing protein [uncultured Methanobrevibacter sp.]|uniref:cysteine-rich small domain-containing protein n=1 Tax=uncultured Methanobrevibacter sp. TaxID=253161 RepID=UPI00261E1AC5
MINLIGIGPEEGNLTLNAYNALMNSDMIVVYDNCDLSFIREKYNGEIFAFELGVKDKINELINSESSVEGSDLDIEAIDEDLGSSQDVIGEDLGSSQVETDEGLDSSQDVIGEDLGSSQVETDDSFEEKSYSELDRLLFDFSKIEFAINASKNGNNVAIVSSKDPNTSGLANVLVQLSSKYTNLDFKIFPSISKLNYVSSILGAPLSDYAVINLNNPILPMSELENKIKNIIEANIVLAINNPISEDGDKTNLNKLIEIVNDFNPDLLCGVLESNSLLSISKFEAIDFEMVDKDSIIIIGSKLSYLVDEYMVTSCDYIERTKLISYNIDFFERYLKDETPKGLDYDCDYLPCHAKLEACDFCYCPFYPCVDGVTGGTWIKDKDVWSCQDCDWIHLEEPCKLIREGLDERIEKVDDLKTKHLELLKLRRDCLNKTL